MFRSCLNDLVARHEMLRTTFRTSEDGPLQVIHPPGEVSLRIFGLSEAPDPAVAAVELMMIEHTSHRLDFRASGRLCVSP